MPRPLTNILYASAFLLGLYITHLAAPGYHAGQVILLGSGYVSLVLIGVTLAIGPITLYLQHRQRNPVNIYMRRDAGIWAGIAGTIHVLYAVHWFNTPNLWSFFLEQSPGAYTLRLNLFGVSNDLGLLATLILLLLLSLSNQASLIMLKGKLWKNIQRLNYPLMLLSAAHALGYQLYSSKPRYFTYFLAAITAATITVQLIGITLHRIHRLHRNPR